MSEVGNRVKKRDTRGAFSREIVKESLLQVFKRKFGALAPNCGDHILDSQGDAVCIYHESSPTDCRFSICPKLDLPLNEAVKIEQGLNPKRGENHGITGKV